MKRIRNLMVVIVGWLFVIATLCSCTNGSSQNNGHGVNPLFGVDWWEGIRTSGWLTLSSTMPLWMFILLGMVSGFLLIRKKNRLLSATVVASIGLCQICFFLCYDGNPFVYTESYFLLPFIIVVLVFQLLLTDKTAIDHNLTGDNYAAKDAGILGIICGAYFVLVPALLYVFTDFLGWAFMGWIVKLFQLWLLAMIVNITRAMVVYDRTDNASERAYYIISALLSIIGCMITISYFNFAGYIASIIVIVMLLRNYFESGRARVRIEDAAEAAKTAQMQKEAESGDPMAICRLGERYWSGKGVETDYDKAYSLFEQAAQKGNRFAFWNLARCYSHGWGAPFNPKKAVELYREAYQRGVNEACYSLGLMYEKDKYGFCDLAKAFNWYLRGAKGGDMDAQFQTAHMYEEGIGVQKNLKEAMEWYKAAADNGHVLSSHLYGVYEYEHGNASEGLKYLRMAKEKGHKLTVEYMNHYGLR